jgi:DNA polymerase III epsilon subunit
MLRSSIQLEQIMTEFMRGLGLDIDAASIDSHCASESIREIVLDVETTGFSPRHGDRIVSIALVELFDFTHTGDRFFRLVNPRRKIPEEATRIHGITDRDVAAAPDFPSIAQSIVDFIGDSPIVGYNVNFDRGFLKYELETAGRHLPTVAFVDVMTLVFQHCGKTKKLHVACADYGIDLVGLVAHSSEDDVLATSLLYIKLLPLLSSTERDFARSEKQVREGSTDQSTYENPLLEKAWRAFQAKDYDQALEFTAEVIAADLGKEASVIDARSYELAAMISRRLKRLDTERDILLTYFRRAVRSDIRMEEITELAEPPPVFLLSESEVEEIEFSRDGYRPVPRIWEMAARLLRVIELGNPVQDRLLRALKAIPSPFGYEEAAICLRKIIADKEARGESIVRDLDALYGFAQQHAFLYEEFFDKNLGYPVHVIVDRVPRNELRNLRAAYDVVGYKDLALLKKIDIRRLVAENGEPSNHASMRDILGAQWEQYHRAAESYLRSSRLL